MKLGWQWQNSLFVDNLPCLIKLIDLPIFAILSLRGESECLLYSFGYKTEFFFQKQSQKSRSIL